MIEVNDVTKGFNGAKVLDAINFRIEDRESFVIIGRSGCGKSVLLKNIIGLMKPDGGRVLIDGTDIVPLDERAMSPIRKKMGVLFQSAALFDSMTVFQNVAFPLLQEGKPDTAEVRRRVMEVLDLVELEGNEEKKPAELSGGMRKRVGLARAIIHQPSILFFDEPTTGLDPVMSDIIGHLILRICDHVQCTSVTVTHDIKIAYMVADRIAMMRNGKMTAIGTPEEIQKSPDESVQRFVHGVSQDETGQRVGTRVIRRTDHGK